MAINQKSGHIGELIRHLRRQRNLTQTELGAERYSKSYVSAVEKNTIRPSIPALQFFATQLDQPGDYFTALLAHPDEVKQGTVLLDGDQLLYDEGVTLLHLLQYTDPFSLQAIKAFPVFAPDFIATLPAIKQSYYALLEGLAFLAKQDYEAALEALERALPLAPANLQPAVLDALGQYYFLMQSYATALSYHLRALAAHQRLDSQGEEHSSLFIVALHCAEDYRVLGNYAQARAMYELARAHLNAKHEMKNAALLFLGLGYCTYALTFQRAAQTLVAREYALSREMERGFQQGIGFVLQSRSLSQVSGDRPGEVSARLLQALTGLDTIIRYRQLVGVVEATFAASGLVLLQDAEEQCRQVLISWQDRPRQDRQATPDDAPTWEALAYLVQIFNQRAILARLRGQTSNALRERLLAAHLCQQALNTLKEPVFPLSLVQEILSSWHSLPDTPPLPHLPILSQDMLAFHPRLIGHVELFCAAAEIAEELGRTATMSEHRQNCYEQAEHCYQMALSLADAVVSAHQRDVGYLVRCYQRCAFMLEERLTATPEESLETGHTLLALVRDSLAKLQNAMVSA